ncbi:hypothetical protein [Pelagibacterium luteolum]|uniref:ASCH domain-containing protein n=1 Tax=Pelagibacterium luteolum TaxID=440168 RepID=A0A1G7YDA2_9HYPH|nr:hypothetical protein [Pelagibacterium luteolum]SDG94538.1 hypothetical protein SAMN04487974_11371 [Pelagibacterium luteolum]
MLIKLEVLEKIKSGEITLQYRRWQRRTVKSGGTLKTRLGVLQIGEITPVAANAVTNADARRAGFADTAEFLAWLDTMKPGDLDRIEVSYKGEDPREALGGDTQLGDDMVKHLKVELLKIDRPVGTGWSVKVLRLIAEQEGVAASVLADALGQEKSAFKSRARELVALGLLISGDIGYRLSPRGSALLAKV